MRHPLVIPCDTFGRELWQRITVLGFATCALAWVVWLCRDAYWAPNGRIALALGVTTIILLALVARRQAFRRRTQGLVQFSEGGTLTWHAASGATASTIPSSRASTIASTMASKGSPVWIERCELGERSVWLRLVADAPHAVGRMDLTITRDSLSLSDWVALRQRVRAVDRSA